MPLNSIRRNLCNLGCIKSSAVDECGDFFFYINEKSLVIKLIEFKIITLLNKINIIINFENLTVELHIFYALNINIEFCVNLILFNI